MTISSGLKSILNEHISNYLGYAFDTEYIDTLVGGDINQAFALRQGDVSFFVKINHDDENTNFLAEALNLQVLKEADCLKVPAVIATDHECGCNYLLLEYIAPGIGKWNEFGRQLAQLHKTTNKTHFGWSQNNFIGRTLQVNHWQANWSEFFAEQRIGVQLELANQQGAALSEEIINTIKLLLADHQPEAVLLHGDLWSGNAGFTADGEPYCYDPACYYGDRETDIAMTELFGGFPQEFYTGYNQVFPLSEDYVLRRPIYNLYHLMNHYNLFGGHYLHQVKQSIKQLM
ncbi:fructosamine kinase family protein [Zooshikella marina]|uniref:fructosamine kinase family protein n=1 Tax=Zooshikella ganghwensis TaxID=202772 RepID=UPI001BB0AD4E|nr:fructosamine kinase family protein [Zooshikella ganghwensis]MBU2706509.1 fructosamine kinase family protein [Zooshikella ganghwensis]